METPIVLTARAQLTPLSTLISTKRITIPTTVSPNLAAAYAMVNARNGTCDQSQSLFFARLLIEIRYYIYTLVPPQ